MFAFLHYFKPVVVGQGYYDSKVPLKYLVLNQQYFSIQYKIIEFYEIFIADPLEEINDFLRSLINFIN